MKSGKAAGCFVVAVPDIRFTSEEKEEFKAIADVVLDDLSQFDGRDAFGLDINLN